MKSQLSTAVCVLFASAVVAAAAAADVGGVDRLVSRRGLQRRFIDGRGNYNISLYHVNDIHAHLDEFRAGGADCTDKTQGCYGGYSRIKEVVETTRPVHKDSLFLNAGDEFQGTLFYTFYKSEKIAETINQLGFDAMTLGNHEFDGGDDLLAGFIKNLTFPVTSCNIHTDHEYLNKTLKPYVLFPKHNLAVVAATTETTPDTSKPGKGTTFENPLVAIQRTVDYVKQKEGINRIIALTHIGYDKDIELAKNTKGIHLIIGGHSHTPLGDFEGAQGKYPTIAENLDGDEVFIVTSYRWGEYLGYIDVAFDPSGKIVSYSGAPIHLTNKTSQSPSLQSQITSWRTPFEKFSLEIVGRTSVPLPQDTCRKHECTLGNFMVDAMLDYRLKKNPAIAGAIMNANGVRASIEEGNITRSQVLTSFPFPNSIVEVTFTGAELWKIFEGIVSRTSQFSPGRKVTSFVQVSRGMKVTYNPANGSGAKLVELQVLTDGVSKPVVLEKTYTIVTLDFLATGGDGFWPAKNNLVALDTQDEVLTAYIKEKSPINVKLENRIIVVK